MKKFSAVLIGVLVLTLITVLIPAVSAAPIVVSRTLPVTATAGGSINVSLAVTLDPSATITSAIIKDYVPSGWNVTATNPTADSFNQETGEVKWVLFGTSLATQTINYTVSIPSKEINGDKIFSGFVLYIEADEKHTDDITGDTSVCVRGGVRWIYVDDDNTGFEDGSKGHPWNTIQEAVNNASDDDTITVRDGTYIENIIVNNSVTIGSENGTTSTIVRAASSASPVFYITADHVNMSGFMVTGASDTSTAGIWLNSTAGYCNISNIDASNNYDGIGLADSNHNILTNITASNNSEYGIYLYSSSNNLIYNNYFNNTNNAWDDGNNIWNITKTAGTNVIGGSYLGGNYWSDYTGEDTDGDGIGDTLLPYNSSGKIVNGGDYLPLVLAAHDTTPPIITFVPPTPANNSEVDVDHVFIYVTTNEPCNTALLNWNGINETMFGAGTNFYLNKRDLSNGIYIYKVYANDTVDNWNVSEARIVTVSVTPEDITPPTITFVDPTPANNSEVKVDYVFVNITTNEPCNTALLNWNGTNETMLGAGANFYLNKTGLSNGIYTYKVYANDTFDNMGVSETRIVTVDIPLNITIDGIVINGMEALSISTLQSVEIPTEISPIETIFIKGTENSSMFDLFSVEIPTIELPFGEIFLECVESLTSFNLTETTIPTEASPFEEIFIKKAETNATFNLTYKINPVAVFSFSPKEPLVGEAVTFNASESYSIGGNITKYEWDFGDDSTALGVVVSHSYASAKSYTVSLTVTDKIGATNSASEIITVRVLNPSVNITTDKYEYTANETMLVNITLKNPAGETRPVYLALRLDLPDYDLHYWVKTMPLYLSPDSEQTLTGPLTLEDYGIPFNASWYVALYNKTTSEVISEDSVDWSYVPSVSAKGETIPTEIGKEIMNTVGKAEGFS